MRCLHVCAIWKAKEDAIQGGDLVDAGIIGAKEMACAKGVGNGSGLWGGT